MATANSHRGIVDLPTELIRHICSFLCPVCVQGQRPWSCPECINQRPGCHEWFRGQLDMSRLSRTCKRLRNVVQPTVFLCYPDSGRWQVRRLLRLARTLMQRPDLAQHMRFLMFREPCEELEPWDRKFVHDSIIQLGLPAVPDHWNIDGDPEFRLLPLELVLAHTPDLEYLRVPLDYDWNLHLLSQLVKTRPPFLTKLKSLEVSHYFIAGDRFDVNMDAIDTIIRAAPNLDSLCLPSPNCGYGSATPMPSLRRLYFQDDCSISPEALTALLDAAPKLEVLALRWAAMADSYDDCADRRTTDAWDAVERRRDSLRELRLDIRSDTEQGDGERDSLKDFENFLSALFAPSIREVTFWQPDKEEMSSAMLRFAKVVAVGRYPNLKSVVIAPSEMSGWRELDEALNAEWGESKGELEEDFGKGNVRFELKWESPYWSACRLD
ncbi:hypothetical protein C8A01DRAFT_21244 [Parachaetomium inaequale]|uniref:Uncharacterized protein n=1 Tax=Parachaetomium inaequale TaxID=2588326 RepID=A0AAN6P4G5_9PEZI|nr:hypothetical protein C8A01DRAFT_21244 [Parachaetomium inaequale]